MAGDLDDQPGENEILLDLLKRRPGGLLLPVGDIGLGDHRSCSISALTTRCQRELRWPSLPPEDSSR